MISAQFDPFAEVFNVILTIGKITKLLHTISPAMVLPYLSFLN